MTKIPSDITQAAREALQEARSGAGLPFSDGAEAIALAILAERNRCAERLEMACKALENIDRFWTEDFPGGPEGDPTWAGGLGRLSDETIEVWKGIRSSITAIRGDAQ